AFAAPAAGTGPAESGALALSPQQRSIALRAAALRAAVPFDARRWRRQDQHKQHQHRSDDERYQEGAEKPHAAMDAAEAGEKAEYQIDDDGERLRHLRRISVRRSLVRRNPCGPCVPAHVTVSTMARPQCRCKTSQISRLRSAAGGRLARRAARSGDGLRGRGPGRRLAVELFLLGFDELPIVRGIEVEQRATRGEMLDEGFADRIS